MRSLRWNSNSWRNYPILQQPVYEDVDKLESAVATIRTYPPLVFPKEIEVLKRHLAEAALGQKFILQGGDCAERFQDCKHEIIEQKLEILTQMSSILASGLDKKVVRVGRIAGQYAKPRTQDLEKVGQEDMPVFRGENVNGFEQSMENRMPDPKRLLLGYHYAAMTLNYCRAMTGVGEDFFTSHEGLLLHLEEALTRPTIGSNQIYNLSAHMLWLGDRTRQLGGAHVEYFRGIANPIGIKIGPNASPDDVIALIQTLNPQREPGKIVIILRLGEKNVCRLLPPILSAVYRKDLKACFFSDPMHGNTIGTPLKLKTRDFNTILREISFTHGILKDYNLSLGGVHLEMTGDDVTEVLGGSQQVSVKDLPKNYQSYCDPRLNYKQSLEMAISLNVLLAEKLPSQKHVRC